MTFEFSTEDQTLTVHHFDADGVYTSSVEMLIEANTGLPAQSTLQSPISELSNDEKPVFINDAWEVRKDHRGEVAYCKSRQNDYQINHLGDLPETHTLLKPSEFDSWRESDSSWQYDQELERPIKVIKEREWRDLQLDNVLSRIDQYEKDQNYPEKLRTSPIKSNEDFLKLLEDRKMLSDYPNNESFPFGERPQLSGLAN
ncbi:hypothetical protein [Vibrio sp. St2]|uniref:hypothetical protein n=1 Tax=Vibrio sp. St2 TaxID=2853441 RepID=UPI00248DE28C|nr:hypothetical protein [Vibrio sp. St2]